MANSDKMSRIALTGPGGIRRLKEYIKELEDRIIALENAPAPIPETHVLEIIDFGTGLTEEEFLSNLLLDGRKPTLDELSTIQVAGLMIKYENVYFNALSKTEVPNTTNGVGFFAGVVDVADDGTVSSSDSYTIRWGGTVGRIENIAY